MSKICLRDVAEGQPGWFCNDCGKRILGVLIGKCPYCGAVFTDYELCKTRLDLHNELISEFPELARGFSKEGDE